MDVQTVAVQYVALAALLKGVTRCDASKSPFKSKAQLYSQLTVVLLGSGGLGWCILRTWILSKPF